MSQTRIWLDLPEKSTVEEKTGGIIVVNPAFAMVIQSGQYKYVYSL